jgi:hypothetical protein
MSADAGGKLRVEVEGFKPLRSNTLFGFVTIHIPALHLRIVDLTVHQKNETRWVSMPGKPQLDREGNVRRDDRGKILYSSVIEFTDKATRDAFSARVIASLLEFAPAAFEPEEPSYADRLKGGRQ